MKCEKQIFLSLLRRKYCLIIVEIVKRPKKSNNYVEILFKQDDVVPQPHTTLSALN